MLVSRTPTPPVQADPLSGKNAAAARQISGKPVGSVIIAPAIQRARSVADRKLRPKEPREPLNEHPLQRVVLYVVELAGPANFSTLDTMAGQYAHFFRRSAACAELADDLYGRNRPIRGVGGSEGDGRGGAQPTARPSLMQTNRAQPHWARAGVRMPRRSRNVGMARSPNGSAGSRPAQ